MLKYSPFIWLVQYKTIISFIVNDECIIISHGSNSRGSNKGSGHSLITCDYIPHNTLLAEIFVLYI